MRLLSKPIYLLALLALSLLMTPIYVRAADATEDEEEDAVVNEESPATEDVQTVAETEADEETGDEKLSSSPFVKTHLLFVKPENTDLPAGRTVKLLVGFQNNGTSPFLVETIEGSFRYPQDFSYYIQNFSVFEFNKIIDADKEATFEYAFTPSEAFSSRQFGLTINLRYKNADGIGYINAVFNDTINVVEPDEGLDGETFFLYIFLVAIVALLLVGGYQLLSTFTKKGKGAKFTPHKVSNGTSNSNDVDFEWIPKEHLQQNKSPKVSPRQRKVRAGASSSGNSSNDE